MSDSLQKPFFCRLCGNRVNMVVDLGILPMTSYLPEKPEEQLVRGRLSVDGCNKCGFMQISSPLPPEVLYRDYHWFSEWKSQPHAREQIIAMQEMYLLPRGFSALEPGCNDGFFLDLLRDCGAGTLVGVEPGSDTFAAALERKLTVIKNFFDMPVAEQISAEYDSFDLVLSRNVLEHVLEPVKFLKACRHCLKPHGTLLIEVPDISWHLSSGDISALWEQHINYFVPENLCFLMQKCGFSVLKIMKHQFSGQTMTVICRKEELVNSAIEIPDIGLLPEKFGQVCKKTMSDLQQILAELAGVKLRIALYGVGARAGVLVNALGLTEQICAVFDDQKQKQQRYLPGCRLLIQAGENLSRKSVDVCLLAVNEECEQKVMEKHRSFTAEGGVFASLLAGSPIFLTKIIGLKDIRSDADKER